MSQPGALRPPMDDPDPTDRLPGLDPDTVVEEEADPLETTGTWSAPAARAPVEPETGDRDAAIAELTSLLREKSFALARVQKELEQARSELLRVHQAGNRGSGLESRLREIEQERAGLAAQHDEQRTTIGRLEDQLSEARESEQALERQLAALRGELQAAQQAQAESAARTAEVEAQLERVSRESMPAAQQQELARLKERITELRNALTVAREDQAGAERERDGLRRQLSQREAELAAGRDALRDRELQVESLLERLRSAEARDRYAADVWRAGPPPAPRVADLERALAAEREARRALEAALEAKPAPPAAGPAAAPAAGRRLIRLDTEPGAVHLLAAPRILIGRTPDNDLQIRESYISRCHAVIRLGPDSAVIEDLDSRNGVFVNDRRVGRELLRDGDVVTLGKARFRFQLVAEAARGQDS